MGWGILLVLAKLQRHSPLRYCYSGLYRHASKYRTMACAYREMSSWQARYLYLSCLTCLQPLRSTLQHQWAVAITDMLMILDILPRGVEPWLHQLVGICTTVSVACRYRSLSIKLYKVPKDVGKICHTTSFRLKPLRFLSITVLSNNDWVRWYQSYIWPMTRLFVPSLLSTLLCEDPFPT